MQITYEDKKTLQNNPAIPNENKVTADDMNKIKSAVNANEEEQQSLILEVQSNTQKIQKNEEDISKLQSDTNQIQEEISNIKTKQNTQNSRLDNLESDNEKNKTDILKNADDISNIKQEQATQNTEIQKNSNNIGELQSNKANKNDVYTKEQVNSFLSNKVDKVEGKGLSSNDFTDKDKEKLDNLENYDDSDLKNRIGTAETQISEIQNKQINQSSEIMVLKEENEELQKKVKNIRANQLQGTEKGELIHIKDSADDEIYEIEIQGNSKQTGEPSLESEVPIYRCGENIQLFNKDNANVINGYLNDAGILAVSTTWKSLIFVAKPNTTYTIQKIIGNAFRVAEFENYPEINMNWSNIIKNDTAQNITYTTSSTGNYIVITFIRDTDTLTEQEILDSIKIEKGTVATPWSPYGMGCISENFSNKNLFPTDECKTFQTDSSSRWISLDGVINAYSSNFQNKCKAWAYLPAGTYTCKPNSFKNISVFQLINEDALLLGTLSDLSGKITFTLAENHFIIPRVRVTNENEDTYMDIQIEPGTIASLYVEHKSQNFIIPTQQPMGAIGDVRDYFVKENDVWYERHLIFEYVAKNDLTSNGMTDVQINLITPTLNIEANLPNLTNKAMSNLLQIGISNNTGIGGTTPVSKIRVLLSKTFATTYEEAINLLTEKGLKIQYIAKEPLKLPCTQEQIEVLEKISQALTYKNETIIYSNDKVPAYNDIVYIRDLQTYLDNRFNELQAQILA